MPLIFQNFLTNPKFSHALEITSNYKSFPGYFLRTLFGAWEGLGCHKPRLSLIFSFEVSLQYKCVKSRNSLKKFITDRILGINIKWEMLSIYIIMENVYCVCVYGHCVTKVCQNSGAVWNPQRRKLRRQPG